MKTLKNKKTDIPLNSECTEFEDYKSLLEITIKTTLEGFDADEIDSRIRLLYVIRNSDEVMNFEDADFKKLTEIFCSYKNWGVVNKHIPDLKKELLKNAN